VLIGHAGHPEVVGTMGQLPPGAVTLIETLEDAAPSPKRRATRSPIVTQTTLSVDDTAEIVAALQGALPRIVGPHKEDICYATTNRQEAVKRVAPQVDAMIVVGAPNSSNSQRLREVAEREGCPKFRAGAARRPISTGRVRRHPRPRHHGRRLGAGSPGRGDHRRLRRALRGLRSRPCRPRDENVFFPLLPRGAARSDRPGRPAPPV
jgi:hypothetical protein